MEGGVKQITTTIKFIFTKTSDNEPIGTHVDIDITNVPKTVVIESLQNIAKSLTIQVIQEAEEFVPLEDIGRYIDARRKVDWETFHANFNKVSK